MPQVHSLGALKGSLVAPLSRQLQSETISCPFHSLYLRMGGESSPSKFAARSDPKTIVGQKQSLVDRGRLWTVFEGTVEIPQETRPVPVTSQAMAQVFDGTFDSSQNNQPVHMASQTTVNAPAKLPTPQPYPSSLVASEPDSVETRTQASRPLILDAESASDSSDDSEHSSSFDTHSVATGITTPPSSPIRIGRDVVFKIADSSTFRPLPHDQLDYGEHDPDSAVSAILNEATLYSTVLRPLQGRYIPRFYGLFNVGDLWIMVLERLGALPISFQQDLHRIPGCYQCVFLIW